MPVSKLNINLWTNLLARLWSLVWVTKPDHSNITSTLHNLPTYIHVYSPVDTVLNLVKQAVDLAASTSKMP